jgi:hypothetical protein
VVSLRHISSRAIPDFHETDVVVAGTLVAGVAALVPVVVGRVALMILMIVIPVIIITPAIVG